MEHEDMDYDAMQDLIQKARVERGAVMGEAIGDAIGDVCTMVMRAITVAMSSRRLLP